MRRSIRTLLLTLVVIFVLAMLTLIIFRTGGTLPRPPLPTPNGYDDFVKASESVVGNVGDYSTLDRAGLDALVSTNAEALRLLRLGLTRRCNMPMDSALTNFAGMMKHLAPMKQLVQLVAAEGRLQEMKDQAADAARSYTDAISFGNELSRGGLIINRLVGIVCESIGCHALVIVIPKLSREESRIVQTELERIDSEGVTWAEVWGSEKYYERHELTTRFNPIQRFLAWWETRQAVQHAETKHKMIVAHVRLLATELALRSYLSQKAKVPPGLESLVPAYLSKVPVDPFTENSMVYHPQGTNWLLYSIGEDGVDDGGKPAPRGWSVKGDIRFDSSW